MRCYVVYYLANSCRVFPIIAPPPLNYSPHYGIITIGGAIGYLTTKLGGGGGTIMGKTLVVFETIAVLLANGFNQSVNS